MGDVTHSTPADGTFSPEGAAAWDAAHTLPANLAYVEGNMPTADAAGVRAAAGLTYGGSGVQVSAPADTNENELASDVLPDMTANAALWLRCAFTFSGSGGTRRVQIKLDETAIFNTGNMASSVAGYTIDILVQNRGVTNAQILSQAANINGTTSAAAAGSTAAVETNDAPVLSITGTKGSAGDTFNLERYFWQLSL